MNEMIVIPQTQIDRMVQIMDFMGSHQGATVELIRQRFDISSDEYNMIYDLFMPTIRKGNVASYWKNKFNGQTRSLSERLAEEDISPSANAKILANDIRQIISEHDVGKSNNVAKEKH